MQLSIFKLTKIIDPETYNLIAIEIHGRFTHSDFSHFFYCPEPIWEDEIRCGKFRCNSLGKPEWLRELIPIPSKKLIFTHINTLKQYVKSFF